MSTRSKVKRQVRRNMRETPKVRRRREAARRAQMAASAGRWVVYHPCVSFVFSPGTINVGGVWRPAPVVLSVDLGEGGPMSDFDRIMREASDNIARALYVPPTMMGAAGSFASSRVYFDVVSKLRGAP